MILSRLSHGLAILDLDLWSVIHWLKVLTVMTVFCLNHEIKINTGSIFLQIIIEINTGLIFPQIIIHLGNLGIKMLQIYNSVLLFFLPLSFCSCSVCVFDTLSEQCVCNMSLVGKHSYRVSPQVYTSV